ncbi:TPA: hypothetical protein ACWLT0_002897 [Pseudomonas aeruginosa]
MSSTQHQLIEQCATRLRGIPVVQMDRSSGIWETGCGQTWSFIEDGPAENGALFCHHCGGRLVLIKSDDQEDDGHGAMGDRDE